MGGCNPFSERRLTCGCQGPPGLEGSLHALQLFGQSLSLAVGAAQGCEKIRNLHLITSVHETKLPGKTCPRVRCCYTQFIVWGMLTA